MLQKLSVNIFNQSSEDMSQVADASVDFVFFAPPYNIGTTYGKNQDKVQTQQWFDVMQKVLTESVRVLKPRGVILIEAADTLLWKGRAIQLADYLQAELVKQGLHVDGRHMNFGHSKDGVVLPDHDWSAQYQTTHNAHSNLHQYVLLSKTKKPLQLGKVFYHNYVPTNMHPCPTPKALLTQICGKLLKPKTVVLEPFMGTGALGELALEAGCVYYGYELDAKIGAYTKKRLRRLV